MLAVGLAHTYVANYPPSQAGKDVYYRVNTGTGATYIARTNTGVVEHGFGKYSIDLAFGTAFRGVLIFDVDGSTRYYAACSINIYDDAVVYSGYGL